MTAAGLEQVAFTLGTALLEMQRVKENQAKIAERIGLDLNA